MKKLLASVVGLFVVLSAVPALASSITDPNDMTSRLDVRKLVYKHQSGTVGTIKVVSDQRYRCTYLVRGLTSLKVYFDGGADGDNDLVGNFVCIKTKSGHRIVLMLHGTKSGNNYEPVPVTRPDHRTVRATFSFDLTELKGKHLDAVARVRDGAAEGCTSAHPCHDRAPDTGTWHVY
jgi:hypothetical protein